MVLRRGLLLPILVATILTFAVPFGLTLAVLAFLLFATLVHFLLRRAQQAQVMLRMLLEIFGCNAVIAQLRITGELVVLVNNLLRRTTHLAFGARAVKYPVDHITAAVG